MATIREWQEEFGKLPKDGLDDVLGAIIILLEQRIFRVNYPEFGTLKVMVEIELKGRE